MLFPEELPTYNHHLQLQRHLENKVTWGNNCSHVQKPLAITNTDALPRYSVCNQESQDFLCLPTTQKHKRILLREEYSHAQRIQVMT